MHVSFITRKGWWGRFTPVSWLASQDVSFRPASGYYNRPSQVLPSGRLRCPRLQLRGSAGFAPASHSPAWSWATIMREPNFEKEREQQIANLPGRAMQSQTPSGVGGFAIVTVLLNRLPPRRSLTLSG